MSDADIVIDLDELDTNKQLPKKHLVYREECEEFAWRIRDAIKANIKSGKNEEENRTQPIDEDDDCENCHRRRMHANSYKIKSNPCFFVNGARGTGKSTFLKALTGELTNPEHANFSVATLAEVDPTELGESESFFVHILSKVYEIMEEYSRCSLDSGIELKNKAAELIDKILNGLKLLSNPKKTAYDFMEEPSFFMEENLKQCINSAELKKLFGELIDVACQMKHAKALLVTVDDADMNFRKCSEIMETVRKYMIIPRLVFIFVGDLNLYSLIVRGMQFRNFDKHELQYDDPRKNHREKLMDQIEEQHIAKLFPAENRINIYYFAAVMKKDVCIAFQGISDIFKEDLLEEGKIKLNNFLEKVFEKLTTKNLKGKYRALLGRLSSRSAYQLIRYCARHAFEKDSSSTVIYKGIADGLAMVASQELIKEQINVSMLEQGTMDTLIEAISRHVDNLNVGLDGASLLPSLGIHSQQMASFYLSAVLLERTDSFRNKLEYQFKTFVLLQALENERASFDSGKTNLYETLSERLLHLGQASYTRWGAIATAQMMPKVKSGSPSKRYGYGTIRLMKKKGVGNFLSLYSVLTELSQDERLKHESKKTLLAFYHSISTVSENNSSCSYFFSVFNLIATMLECLEVIENGKSEKDKEIEELKKKLKPKSNFTSGGAQFIEKINDSSSEDDEVNARNKEDGKDKVHAVFSENLSDDDIENVANDIRIWGKKHIKEVNNKVPVYSNLFEMCWEKLYSSWLWRTDDMSMVVNSNSLVKAGDLMVYYMNAVTSAIEFYWGDNKEYYSELIKTFPLWEAFVKEEEKSKDEKAEKTVKGGIQAKKEKTYQWFLDHLNKLNIGQKEGRVK